MINVGELEIRIQQRTLAFSWDALAYAYLGHRKDRAGNRNIEGQRTMVTALLDMDAEITALEGCRDKVRAIKQGMIQELLTGRVRLVKPAVAT